MNKFLQIPVILAVMLIVSLPGASHAQKVLEEFKQPLPDIELISKPEWEAQSILYEEDPVQDEELAYSLRLPQDWEKITDGGMSTYEVSNKIFGQMARYYGPVDMFAARSRFDVQVLELDYKLTAEQWLLQYLLANGFNVQGLEPINENKVEALYVLIEHQESYAVRAVAHIVGNRVVLAQYFMPMDNWEEEKAVQATALASFTLKNKTGEELVEKMTKYLFLDIAELEYPASWELRSRPIRSIDVMEARLFNFSNLEIEGESKALNGRIDMKLVSAFSIDSLKDEIEEFKQSMLGEDLILGELIEKIDPYDVNERFEFANTEVFKVSNQSETLRYELWVSVMLASDYYYFAGLLTPVRDEDYYTWVRNSETFRIINEHWKPLDESVVER